MACKSQNSSVKVISCRDFKILLRKLSDKNNRSIVHTIEGKQQNKINLDIKAKMQHIHLKEGRCTICNGDSASRFYGPVMKYIAKPFRILYSISKEHDKLHMMPEF